jgi:tetratricopeptide (TPR) repeat protein
VISEGVARFTDSPVLHDRLRAHALATRGIEGLETAYDKLLEDAGGSASLHWYAGQAAIVAAEYHRRAWNVERCVAAYDRAIGLYEKAAAADASLRGDADHRIALALASRGRFAFEREDYDRAVADVVASFEKSPTSAASLDGLSFSPAATAQMLLARLKQEKKDELAAKLEKALSKLDPALLVVPKGM